MTTILRGLAAISRAFVASGSEDGCCTCGGPHADYSYYGAMEGSDLSSPDWEQCADCHNEDSAHGAWMRTLRHEAKVTA